MTQKSVSIRLGTTGKATVTRDFDEIAQSGDASAKRYAKAFERASDDVEAALQRQARAADKIAAIMPQTAVQMKIGDVNGTGFGQWEGSARRSALAFKELLGAQEQLEVRTRALLASINPAIAAQDRFNAEMAEARTLVAASSISLDDYCAKLRIEKAALDAVAGAHNRANVSVGQLKAGSQQLSYQIGDVAASFGSGTPVVQIFAQQIGQTVQAVQLMTGASKGFLGFIAGPWGAVLTGGIIILTTLVGKYLESADAAKKAEAAKRADAAATNTLEGAIKQLNDVTGNYNRSQATTIELALNNANTQIKLAEGIRATTAARLADMKALQAANRQRASGPGQSGEIAAMGLADGDKAIATVEASLSQLDANLIRGRNAVRAAGAEARRVRADETASAIDGDARLIVSTGRVAEAERALRKVEQDGRRELAAGTITEDQYRDRRLAAERRLIAAQDSSTGSGEARARGLARQSAAMEVNADAALDLARAYLVGSDAALRAEAARKGLTDATRKGIDGEAQTRRQLAIMVGDEVVSGAKAVAKLRDEADARANVRKEILAGTWTWDQANDALAEEAALRPLLKLQTLAQGEALATLTKVIDEYRAAMRRARAEEAEDGSLKAAADAQGRADEMRSVTADLELSAADRRRNADRRAAVIEADRSKFTGEGRKNFLKAKSDETEAGIDGDRARYLSDTLRSQRDSLATVAEELRLVGANDNLRQSSLAKLRLILDLKEQGVALDSDEGREILRNADAYDAIVDRLHDQQLAWEEIRGFGEEFVDTVLSPETWEDWGEGGKTILKMIQNEFLKLALLNPIKNMLTGGDAATLGSVLGNLGSLFGGKGAAPGASASQGFIGPPGNAAGTHYWSGGDTLVGENGAEVVSPPRGSRVTPAGETRRLLAANDGGPRGNVQHFDLRGAVVTEKLYSDMLAIGDAAAVRGAAGGAQMGFTETKARAGRRLGRKW
ncbi:hypothetical protein ASE70_07990 [Sphingomonas sp. Leaf22]|uniref:hypothetical protein n=1 Tax=Sphingomonas sp. Leaf22 TaxID=1735687 RepID=UPI0006FDBF13|nr:hypothetical protein [Sphingomonas sp. Leaf22]KQM76702.1 hypothetical protein ASE70_07990 [Sphingomonas sp. Leaf22]